MSGTDDHCGCSDAGVARSGDLRPSQRMGGGEASGVNRYDAVVGRTPPDTLGEILGAAVAESAGGCELLLRTFGDACIGGCEPQRGQRRPRFEIGRAHIWTPVTPQNRMPASSWKKKKNVTYSAS